MRAEEKENLVDKKKSERYGLQFSLGRETLHSYNKKMMIIKRLLGWWCVVQHLLIEAYFLFIFLPCLLSTTNHILSLIRLNYQDLLPFETLSFIKIGSRSIHEMIFQTSFAYCSTGLHSSIDTGPGTRARRILASHFPRCRTSYYARSNNID